MKTVRERFESKYMPVTESGCWLWTASCDGKGYGQLSNTVGATPQHLRAHRVAYEIHKGLIPDGMTLDHLCRVRSCVNPDHLEPVTRKENILRGVAPSALNAVKTHCPHGHPYNKVNTYITTVGGKDCRACGRLAWEKPNRRLSA